MTNKTWLIAVALAFPLASCGTDVRKSDPRSGDPRQQSAQTTEAPDCQQSDTECHITVIVGPRCNVSMSKDRFVVAPHPRGVEMLWTIKGNASFAERSGIEFKTPDFQPMKEKGYYDVSSPKGVFLPSSTKTLSAKEHRKRNAGKPGNYYYVVNVVQDGKPCAEYDPGVVNQ